MGVVGLKGELLKDLLEAQRRSGGNDLAALWDRVPGGAAKEEPPPSPDNATVYRWIQGQLPRKKSFMRLCAVLDVDPLALLTARDGDMDRAIEHLLSSFQLEHWHNPALSFLKDFFGRQKSWPPAAFARQWYGRDWIEQDFEHEASSKRNYYATVEIAGCGPVFSERPQICHFAFRIPGFFRNRWLEFGIVERHGRQVRLFHINGHVDSYVAEDPSDPSLVEMWFGPGPAVFRVASLHAFSSRVTGESRPDQVKVRFPG
ncbi:hypothetical protein FQ775_06805 [Nitratireductor mangrovi]|uniref:Uncharacterized protein n=1 Tax=Nitratireductor mangrovi TaxID=2599600 RepID=A0A5B8KWZ5_9HYPH|nr:hypothetical protein [Nitratireductor mangrovi]QDZ00113.1 hypothetical protein FQ775_06805 [Nitratireductor mangrovi]